MTNKPFIILPPEPGVTIELDLPNANDPTLEEQIQYLPDLTPMHSVTPSLSEVFPVLTDALSPDGEAKARTIFFITFFNSEQRRDQLARHGFLVKRMMRGTSTANYVVLYHFPAVDSIAEEKIMLRSDDPFATRDRLFNAFMLRYRHIRRKEVIQATRTHLESTLNPDQLQAISELDSSGLEELFKR